MSKPQSQEQMETQQNTNTTQYYNMETTLKKLKRVKFFEPSLSVIGFFFVTVCVICCFFYLDYRTVVRRFRFPFQSQRFQWLKIDYDGSNNNNDIKVDFLSEMGSGCDVFDGDWVWDERYPLYKSRDCKFVDAGFRCSESGRPDNFYTKWRWQPKLCNLPRMMSAVFHFYLSSAAIYPRPLKLFDAKLMLEKLRNKRVVFIGDSIGRNQWESLLCILASAVPDQNRIFEVNGNPITKHKGFLVFKFEDYNLMVEYYRSPFLVLQARPPAGAPDKVKSTLRVDQMDWNSGKWKDADVLILNTGHWWNYEKTLRGGCYFQVGPEIHMNMTENSAYRRSLETVLDWIDKELNTSKTQVFFRTYAPVHFRGGDWRTGGACNMETLPELGVSKVSSKTWPKLTIATEVLSARSNQPKFREIDVLNITVMSHKRKDGHSSLYYLGPGAAPASIHRQDCSHWCLPGVPDSWNELLYALFLKREASRTWNSTAYRTQVV